MPIWLCSSPKKKCLDSSGVHLEYVGQGKVLTNGQARPLLRLDREAPVCFLDIAYCSLQTWGEAPYEEANDRESTPSAGVLTWVNRAVDGSDGIKGGMQQRKVLNDAEFPRLPWFWYDTKWGSLEGPDKKLHFFPGDRAHVMLLWNSVSIMELNSVICSAIDG